MSDVNIGTSNLITAYDKMTTEVSAMSSTIGASSATAGVSMSNLFQLQLKMNNLSMFGTTLTNVIQGIQEVAMGVARNAKGS